MEGKTCIVIAHHLATIQKADVIFVVKDFQIAERGTHAELLAAGGLYSELYGLQLGTGRATSLPTNVRPHIQSRFKSAIRPWTTLANPSTSSGEYPAARKQSRICSVESCPSN